VTFNRPAAAREFGALSALLALGAAYGALGLACGFLSLGEPATSRLPFASPVVGGLALAAVVAVPSAAAAWLLWRGHPHAWRTAAGSGALLLAWIAIEVAVIRQFSPLQVVCGFAGLVLLTVGARRG